MSTRRIGPRVRWRRDGPAPPRALPTRQRARRRRCVLGATRVVPPGLSSVPATVRRIVVARAGYQVALGVRPGQRERDGRGGAGPLPVHVWMVQRPASAVHRGERAEAAGFRLLTLARDVRLPRPLRPPWR